MNPLRVYVDTSVVGGCEDDEFAEDSVRIFREARRGRLVILMSDLVIAELHDAPASVQAVLLSLPSGVVRSIPITPEVIALRDAYLAAKVVARRSLDDATHVAAATCARADAIVSWNFKDIVRLDRIKAYNQVNLMNGYGILTIVSPREVAFDEPHGR